MGYSNFKKIRQVKERFGVDFMGTDIFDTQEINKIEPSDWLKTSLKHAYINAPTNEKAKSERLVSPVLLEVLANHADSVSFFSGEEINIDAQEDLAGPCDFFFSLKAGAILLEAPVISIVEAKDEDLEWGIAQCAAQLYAARLFNEQEGKDLPVLYGCATTGTDWQFMRFENNTFYIDRRPQTDLPHILGIWHRIFQFFLKR